MNKEVIFVFRARSQTMKLFEVLSRNNVRSVVISTPRALSLGCGLSVKINAGDFAIAAQIVRALSLNTFSGAYYYDTDGYSRVSIS